MAKINLKSGTKLDVTFTDDSGAVIEVKSTFEKNEDEVTILISRPLHQGKPVSVDENTRLILEGGQQIVVSLEGYVEGEVRRGPRTYWRVRTVNNRSVVNQRADARIKAELALRVQKTYWNQEGIDSIETLDCLSLDISNGGIAFYLNAPVSAGEILELELPKQGRFSPVSLRGEACWMREADQASAYRYITGVRFLTDNARDRDRITRYVAALAKK